MRRMARKPAALKTRPPRHPPSDTLNSFTQDGQCPLTNILYFDNSKTGSNRPLHLSTSRLRWLMEADRKGKGISRYRDSFSLLKPTLGRYRQYIESTHVAVIGTEKPWAEAMLLNLGARHITTLEFRAVGIATTIAWLLSLHHSSPRTSSMRRTTESPYVSSVTCFMLPACLHC